MQEANTEDTELSQAQEQHLTVTKQAQEDGSSRYPKRRRQPTREYVESQEQEGSKKKRTRRTQSNRGQ